ncbi:succinylglutamate desuccinylase/aspartoacylase domain-containing protein [Halocatena salina]|uniref:Succinylglutamate desuccinylase/aspartoacylase family protein n=1 Tax=Halocatena salina TaxID=2934340 RepID=A0A8T9ZYC2_9EURY|nr:succinylglutamate desuccinylase/aspartoacylase family protein [Halocatena salina]UPM41652.1 succinylglutamate desuccinylase/aspartoacylase family protein [Halocatena salina]
MRRRSFIKAFGVAGGLVGLGSESTGARSDDRRTQLMAGTEQETTLSINDSSSDGLTTLVVGGMHGNEPAGYLAGDDIQDWTPDTGALLVLPRANAVAVQNGAREANGDLNRQFPLTESPTTELAREIWNVVTEFQPDLVIDMHESVGRYIDGWLGQSVGYSPLRNGCCAAQLSIDAVNESIDASVNHFHPRFLPRPSEDPTGVFVQRTAFELGIPTYIIETYKDLDLSARIRWQKAHVKRLIDALTAVAASDPTHVLAVDGEGSRVAYTIAVDGTITATDTTDAHDAVGDSRVNSLVHGGVDYYHFTGQITTFDVTHGDSDDITVYVDGVKRTHDELTPQESSQLRLRSTGDPVEYQLGVTESFTATQSMDSEEWVFEDRAYGVVDGDPDVYEYKRAVDHFNVTSGDSDDLTVTVDGHPVTADVLDVTPTHDLLIRGATARYRFAVSGTVSGVGSQSHDRRSESTASGRIGDSSDHYRFTGAIISFDLIRGDEDDLELLVDGNERTIAALNPSDIHELRVSGTGSRTPYAFEVSGIVYPTATATGEDHVGVDRVSGAVAAGHDDYLFRGDVTAFRLPSGSFEAIDVFLDGRRVSLTQLNPRT